MKRLSLSLFALLLACPATAATKITGETTARVGGLVNLQAETDVAGAALIWDVFSGGAEVTDTYENSLERRLIFAGTAGVYTVKVRAISFKGDKTTVETARATVTIGDVPPGPGPGPQPPGPGPAPPEPPSPAPIPAAGLRVLIILETADATKLPTAQHTILFGKAVRDYLNAKCVVGADGKTKEWRIWDQNVATDAESKLWQDAMKRPHPQLPWLVISNGKAGYEGPLPANPEAMMTLLKKYAE